MALNKKDEAERLRIQLEIQESLERQTKNLSSWRDAQKQLVKNAKLLKNMIQEYRFVADRGAKK